MRLCSPLTTLGSKRICQYLTLPENNARFTPRSRAASTLARICQVQYSSCPMESHPLWRSRSQISECVSMFVLYVTSYPSCSSHRTMLYSQPEADDASVGGTALLVTKSPAPLP